MPRGGCLSFLCVAMEKRVRGRLESARNHPDASFPSGLVGSRPRGAEEHLKAAEWRSTTLFTNSEEFLATRCSLEPDQGADHRQTWLPVYPHTRGLLTVCPFFQPTGRNCMSTHFYLHPAKQPWCSSFADLGYRGTGTLPPS